MVSSETRSRTVKFFWRTQDMMTPRLVYCNNLKTNETAFLASLVPTFEPLQPSETDIEIVKDEEPDMTELVNGSDFHFIFVVDRSGSMYGSRMADAINALKIFIRSLPVNCHFTIKSFGS